MRSLVTIREISDIKPIDGADAIELVIIKGWQEFADFDDGFARCFVFEVSALK